MKEVRARRLHAVFVLACVILGGAASPKTRPVEDEFTRHLRFLASDQLKGRGNGSPELDIAADYIAQWFGRKGLRPAGDGGAYFQEFSARADVEMGPRNWVTISLEEGSERLQQAEYRAVFFGPGAAVVGVVAFAGFGVTAPELNYDDYRGFDARGKVVAVFQHEPEEKDEASRFAGTAYSPYATLTYKAINAKAHGAAALLVLTDPLCDKDRRWNPGDRPESLGIPVVKLSEHWSRRLIDLAQSRAGIDLRKAVRESLLAPFDLPGVAVSLSVDAVEKQQKLKNVVGLIPGSVDEYIVIGAHYDHLGLGARKSLAPDRIGEIHNGADDNASGTAGLLRLASMLAPERRGRGVLLIAFAGEEIGLLGATAYVSHPSVGLGAIRAMINLDMIGRSNGEVFIGGVGTAVEFRALLDSLQPGSGLEFKFAETPQAASDHLLFSGEKIPVLYFFSGLHPDYHTPSDDWEKIDRTRTEQILAVVAAVTRYLRQPGNQTRFVETDSDSALLGGSVGPALLGLMTAYYWEGEGILVASVKPDTPASEAGFQAGDIVIGCDGRAVFNRLDLIELLTEEREPMAQGHTITVLRGESVVRLTLRAGRLAEASE
jgi:aminopeptidase YwaD